MSCKPHIVFCADDFTGASDTLATLSKAGLNTRLYLQPPSLDKNPELSTLDAIGLATSLRSKAVESSTAEMAKIASALALLNADFYHYKVCSTFDSSTNTGNIAIPCATFALAIDARWTAIIGGQASLKRYCIFGHLYAKATDEAVYRIDRHPLMMQHPITPMTESDLRLHLQSQGMADVGLVSYTDYSSPFDTLAEQLNVRIQSGETHTLFDVSCDEDLLVIGQLLHHLAARHKVLCIGASSVAEALANNVGSQQSITQKRQVISKPVLAIAGSRSPATARQIQSATCFKKITLGPDVVTGDVALIKNLARSCIAHLERGNHLLLHLEAKSRYSLSSQQLASWMAELIEDIVSADVSGLLTIAGGDTSSLALERLGPDSLSFVEHFDKGAPLIQAHSNKQHLNELPMILKGGQMGALDFFDQTVRWCEKSIGADCCQI